MDLFGHQIEKTETRRPHAGEFDGLLALRPAGGFGLIMADPPWDFETRSPKGAGKSPQAHYSVQPLDWIKSVPVAAIAAPDCLLWLWATNPMLPQALDVIAAWGFEFKTGGHWVKRTKHGRLTFGTGYIFRSAGEPYLVGTRGRPRTTKSVRSIVEGVVREHSRKPDEAFEAAERLMPDVQRIELFSRQARPGWRSWGDQVDKFEGAET